MSTEKLIVIVVMGTTGTGKSSFIRRVTGKDVKVGHGIDSETQDVEIYNARFGRKRVAFIDTPGFDDTYRTDAQVLELVGSWLERSYTQGVIINGVIYLHKINDNRWLGTSLKKLRMFQKIVGNDSLKKVILATTMWDLVPHDDGEAREAELIAKHWEPLTDFGMQVRRLDSPNAYMSIVADLMKNVDAAPLLIQRELVDEHKTLAQTQAGEEIMSELRIATSELKAELAEVANELRQTKANGEKNIQALTKVMESTKRDLTAKLEQAVRDRQTLEASRRNEEALRAELTLAEGELQSKKDEVRELEIRRDECCIL